MMNQEQTTKKTRERVFEDELLRKIQSEVATESMKQKAQSIQTKLTEMLPVRDNTRPSYENDLVQKMMAQVQNRQRSKQEPLEAQQSETLMITSAVPLTEEQKERIVRKFIDITHKKLRRITTVTDSSLITGVRLQSETFYCELSGQKTLRELRKYLEKSWHQGDETH